MTFILERAGDALANIVSKWTSVLDPALFFGTREADSSGNAAVSM
jgi:hypothetical protein